MVSSGSSLALATVTPTAGESHSVGKISLRANRRRFETGVVVAVGTTAVQAPWQTDMTMRARRAEFPGVEDTASGWRACETVPTPPAAGRCQPDTLYEAQLLNS
jgi:hypothetical protein